MLVQERDKLGVHGVATIACFADATLVSTKVDIEPSTRPPIRSVPAGAGTYRGVITYLTNPWKVAEDERRHKR